MFGRKECYLCGGKLANGRCTLCGLDNTRAEKRDYRLNESRSEQKKIRSSRDSQKKNTARTVLSADQIQRQLQKKWTAGDRKRPENRGQKTGKTSRGKKSGGKIGIAVIAVLIAGSFLVEGAGALFSYVKEEVSSTVSSREETSGEDTYDPYAYVSRELSDEGEEYETVLTGGNYTVGVHLPEGQYAAELEEGNGYVSISDPDNGIYLSRTFGTEEEYDEITKAEDLRLYEGAFVRVSPGGSLKFSTENGQVQEMESEENPLAETQYLEPDRSYTAGTDFPEGVYDASGEKWTDIQYEIYLGEVYEEEELNYESGSVWFTEGENGEKYQNLVLPKGAKVTAEGGEITLTPSRQIGSRDYDAYYDIYR